MSDGGRLKQSRNIIVVLNLGALQRWKMCDETELLANSCGFDHRFLFLLAPFNRFHMCKPCLATMVMQLVRIRELNGRGVCQGTKYISKVPDKIVDM